ncbi:MAG: hypothetical protein LBM08_04190 [Dysgonamonadaceae bacterium]|nr:hypothetical protein [Dysgonamonadaceae bacterium]
MNGQIIKRTNVNRNEYRILQTGILKNIGTLECQNVGTLEQQITHSYNLLNIRINIKTNKEINNGLINPLYN